jgi:hypothetical protein
MPVFEQHGGIYKIKKIFGDALSDLIREINKEIAA